jgi:hypothetical protein
LNDSRRRPPAVLLSGGSEIVTASLAEEFSYHGIGVAVIGLGRRSILRGPRNCLFHEVLDWPPSDVAATAGTLQKLFKRLGNIYGLPLPVFATEDGGLRLLLEHQDVFDGLVSFGRCRNLRMGGLDKCELFSFLEDRGFSRHLAPWARARCPSEAARAKTALGGDVIAKPSIKPYSMKLGLGDAKLLHSLGSERPEEFEARISTLWRISPEWMIQKTLSRSSEGEELLHCSRAPDSQCTVIRAVERIKHPSLGGTGCVVESMESGDYDEVAYRIAEACDLVGLAELPFLVEDDSTYRLIEINPRAWLQVLLPHRAGLSMGYLAYLALLGESSGCSFSIPDPGWIWVNLERLLQSILRRNDPISPVVALKYLLKAKCIVMHDSRIRGLRIRWFARMVRRAIGNAT